MLCGDITHLYLAPSVLTGSTLLKVAHTWQQASLLCLAKHTNNQPQRSP